MEQWFNDKQGAITAFSGGVDSTLVLYLSHVFLKERAVGCISISPSLKRKDYQFAIDFCRDRKINLEVIETKELVDENYYANPANRCYFCKSHLYQSLDIVSKSYPGYILLNGTNTDDLGDYRPGLDAAKENQVLSPLLDCDIDKATVRTLAKHLNLPNWQKPASPCLSSRVPYGEVITSDKLARIEAAEGILNAHGFEDVRVRHFGTEARIEVPHHKVDTLRGLFSNLEPEFIALGFESCAIDEEGLVSGKLNRALKN